MPRLRCEGRRPRNPVGHTGHATHADDTPTARITVWEFAPSACTASPSRDRNRSLQRFAGGGTTRRSTSTRRASARSTNPVMRGRRSKDIEGQNRSITPTRHEAPGTHTSRGLTYVPGSPLPSGAARGLAPRANALRSTAMATPERAADFAGSPDAFERLWTPHRMVYIDGERPSAEAGDGCPFCAAPARRTPRVSSLHRGRLCYVVLNLFPYNPGHVLICPYGTWRATSTSPRGDSRSSPNSPRPRSRRWRAASCPMGFNIGMNQGAVAGAGVAGPPAPARRAPLGRRRQLPAGHRPDQGSAGPARGCPIPSQAAWPG
jgi:ATP adenylyltransferase